MVEMCVFERLKMCHSKVNRQLKTRNVCVKLHMYYILHCDKHRIVINENGRSEHTRQDKP